MSEIVPIVASGVIGALSGVLGSYVVLKISFSNDTLLEKAEILLEDIAKNEAILKNVYQIGGVLGSGIAQGTGLQRKGGKFGMQDLIMSIVGRFMGGGQKEAQEQPLNITPYDKQYR